MHLRETTKMVALYVTILLEFDYDHTTRSIRPACARPDCGLLECGEHNIHNIPTTYDIVIDTTTTRRQRTPGSDQYHTRYDTTSTPASRLTLGGFSDNGRSSPTCS